MARRINEFEVLDALLALGPTTPAEIALWLGHGRAGVAAVDGVLTRHFTRRRRAFRLAGLVHLSEGWQNAD